MSQDKRDDDGQAREGWTIRRDPPESPDGDHPAGASRPPIHVGCGTLGLAAIVGYPVGLALSDAFLGQEGFGGFIGIFVMMLVFGFFTRRFQIMAEQGKRLPGFLGDGEFWKWLGIGAVFGFFFGPLGSGLLAGMGVGIAIYAGKRLLRR